MLNGLHVDHNSRSPGLTRLTLTLDDVGDDVTVLLTAL